jgi:hypothetical protein
VQNLPFVSVWAVLPFRVETSWDLVIWDADVLVERGENDVTWG